MKYKVRSKETVLLIGTGTIGVEYAKVLKDLSIPHIVIGRGKESAKIFEERTGTPVITGGLEKYLNHETFLPPRAIVATDINQLSQIAMILLDHGVNEILLEKPGGLRNQLPSLLQKAITNKADVYIAYNRRFYASTKKARDIITQDGGVSSFTFNFTERSHLIENSTHPHEIKQEWFLANSSHVVDLAFFLGGKPSQLQAFTAGSLEWHSSSSTFAGSGITEQGALFSYHANWASIGNWGIDIYTKNYRLILNPLEELHLQRKRETTISKVDLEDYFDISYKPGIYHQTKSFIEKSTTNLLTLTEHYNNIRIIYNKILRKEG